MTQKLDTIESQGNKYTLVSLHQCKAFALYSFTSGLMCLDSNFVRF